MSLVRSIGLFLSFSLAMILNACSEPAIQQGAAGEKAIISLSVHNSADLNRYDELVFIPLNKLPEGSQARFTARLNERELPSQLIDEDGDGREETLAVQVNIASKESLDLKITPELASNKHSKQKAQAEISRKIGGKWQGKQYLGGEFENVTELSPPPAHTDHSQFIRYEGPGIESDKVAYRFYLDERNGFDIFGKRTHDMVLHTIGLDGFESYHNPAAWGMDILKVGASVGVGGWGYWDGEQLKPADKVEGWQVKILNNGPIYASLSTLYKHWQVKGNVSNLVSTVSMQAGSRLAEVRLRSSMPVNSLAAGIVKLPNTTLLQDTRIKEAQNQYRYLATWGQQSLAGDELGMALFFRANDIKSTSEDDHNHVVVFKDQASIHYYFAAAWVQEPNGITSQEAFETYLKDTAHSLENPLEISVP